MLALENPKIIKKHKRFKAYAIIINEVILWALLLAQLLLTVV